MEKVFYVSLITGIVYLVTSLAPVVTGGVVPSCTQGKPADLLFILDASSSIWGPHYRQQLGFVRQVVGQFDVSPTTYRIGVITFGDYAFKHFGLGAYQSEFDVIRAIGQVYQSGGNTRTDGALLRAREEFTSNGRPGVAHVAVVMTDGRSDFASTTRQEAILLHQAGVQVIAVGIGENADTDELTTIASSPDLVYTVDTYDALNSLKNILAIKACELGLVNDAPIITDEDTIQGLPSRGCDGRPADIVLALDASSSIWGPDFETQLLFVQDLISVFEVAPSKTRFGVLSFSDSPDRVFHLEDHVTEEGVKHAISRIVQTLGGTRTDRALRSMRTHLFSSEHARSDVVHIGMVITDGQSEDPEATAKQAALAREAGITMFAIGVGGGIDVRELQNIASAPADQYVFTVDNYAALQSLKELLHTQACKVTTTTTSTTSTTPLPTTTTTPLPTTEPMITACGQRAPADIVFALPPTSDQSIGENALCFMRDTVRDLEIGEGKVRVGMVPRPCAGLAATPGFKLDQARTKQELLALIAEPANQQERDNARTIRYMRTHSFRQTTTPKPSEAAPLAAAAKRVGVVVVDGNSISLQDTAVEAMRARLLDNIELFVVALDSSISDEEIQAIASKPVDSHFLRLSDYDNIQNAAESMREKLNDYCSGL